MFILLPIVFILGILGIAFEDKIKINKAAIALVMSIIMWLLLMLDAYYIFVERANPEFENFLMQNPDIAAAPLKDQFVEFITNRAIV